jgi:hypothetical protein
MPLRLVHGSDLATQCRGPAELWLVASSNNAERVMVALGMERIRKSRLIVFSVYRLWAAVCHGLSGLSAPPHTSRPSCRYPCLNSIHQSSRRCAVHRHGGHASHVITPQQMRTKIPIYMNGSKICTQIPLPCRPSDALLPFSLGTLS